MLKHNSVILLGWYAEMRWWGFGGADGPCNKGTASIAGVLGAQPKLIPPCEIPKVVLLDWMQLQRSWSKIEDSQEKVAERQHAQVFIATE